MPVQALRTTSTGRNGLGAFILQCKKLEFHYCDWAGSSKGMNAFLTHLLPTFTRSLPTIEMHVSPRPHTHPVIRAHYINGRAKAICVRNMEMEQVRGKARVLAEAGGEKNARVRGGRVVGSLNEGVRGVWDPFHGAGDGGRVLLGGGRGR